MREVERILREHRENKAKLEIILARIEAYEIALINPDVRSKVYYVSSVTIGMPKSNLTPGSIVEKNIMDEEKICEALRTLIENEKSKTYHLKFEVDIVEKALRALTKEEKYIIECRYFNALGWQDTERNFNKEFYENNDDNEKFKSMHGLRKINAAALDKLDNMLNYNKIFPKVSSEN